jgi:2-oxo-hept-3-ene-1,7-dioate hydratase/2-keto-4-pentenoate hydratase
MDTRIRDSVVDELLAAYRTHVPVKPLAPRLPGITVADAYAIQQEFTRRKIAKGHRLCGYKVGLTSKAMRDMAGATEPDFAALTSDFLVPEGETIECARLFTPMVELELVLVLKERLKGPGVTVVDVMRATDFVVPAIELVDLRIERGPGLSLVDNIADIAFCGAVVIGGNPRRLDQIDIRRVAGSLVRNDVEEQSGYAAAAMGNPITVVAWLANKLSEFDVAFDAGHAILTGSFVRAIPVVAGDRIVCRFDQGLGDVSLAFA